MSMKEIGAPVSGENSKLVVMIIVAILSIVGVILMVNTIYSKLESAEVYQAEKEALMIIERRRTERKLEDKEQLLEKLETLQNNSKTILNQQEELERALLELGEASGTDN